MPARQLQVKPLANPAAVQLLPSLAAETLLNMLFSMVFQTLKPPLPVAEMNMFYFPLVVLGIHHEFTSGHMFSFFLGTLLQMEDHCLWGGILLASL